MPTVAPDPITSPLTRLPGRQASLRVDGSPGGTLWLGTNHLLQVQTGALREGYRRFAYHDIQSITVRRTPRGLIYNLILGGTAALFGVVAVLVAVSSAYSPGGVGVAGSIAGFSLVLALVNILRGMTVRSDLRTAVGIYPLPSLSRMGPARRALGLIGQRVDAVQGTLSGEVLAERVARSATPSAAAATPVAGASYPNPAT